MNNKLSEKEVKEILEDLKFRPYYEEFKYRRDHTEKAVVNLGNNIVLVKHKAKKDIINCNDQDTINHVFIESENLYALSALGMLRDKDKFDIVLIDPLYGTQGGDFRYNDKIIDKDDPQGMLKWKMSIENRLKLAKQIMKPDGIIMAFENYENCHLLRLCMDKIFGRENVLAHRPWKKKAVPGPQIKGYQDHIDYIIVYSMNKKKLKMRSFQVPKKGKILERYKYDDGKSIYEIYPLEKSGSAHALRPTKYDIKAPDGSIVNPIRQWWSWSKENYYEHKDEFILWKWREKGTKKWNQNLDMTGKKHIPYTDNSLNKIDKLNVEWKPMIKAYYVNEDGSVKMSTPSCIIDEEEIYKLIDEKGTLNIDGNSEAEKYINKKVSSMSPKPVEVIKRMIKEVNRKDVKIIDFYGGLATTVQAVIELNQEDKQKRICYYVQNEEGIDKNDNNRIIDDAYLRIKNLMKKIKKEQNENCFSTGLKQNLRYFKTRLIPVNFLKISHGQKYRIFQHSEDLIKLINDSYILAKERKSYKLFLSKKYVILIFNEKWDNSFEEEQQIERDIEENDLLDKEIIIYEWSSDNECKSDAHFDKTHPIPHEIENIQKRLFKLL